MRKIKELKENKIFRIITSIIRMLVVVIMVGFILVVCLQRFSGNKISFFNYRMFTVISGSMSPKYEIGDVLISKEVDPSEIKVGDTISYYGERGDVKDKVITHQVTKVEKDENGKYRFRAKGLTNLIEDPTIFEHQLYGVVIYKSVILSIIYRIVATRIGFYLFIIIPFMFIIGSEIVSTLLAKEEKRRQKN
ncbi:MAG TPA: signal peptidase I [Mollicutes bacterium]|nr:signal peptidase I [Mollicutes bacterium]